MNIVDDLDTTDRAMLLNYVAIAQPMGTPTLLGFRSN
jgi:hypothetical protein